MTHHKDPITTAARLLREAADEYADGIRINGEPDWANAPETHAAYLEHMCAAQALDNLADSLGAGGVSPLRRPQCLHQIDEPALQWISVSEQIPKAAPDFSGVPVMTYWDDGSIESGFYCGQGNWQHADGDMDYHREGKVTHWAPMPTPPSTPGVSDADQA